MVFSKTIFTSFYLQNVNLCHTWGGGALTQKGVWGCEALKTPFTPYSQFQGSHLSKPQFTSVPFQAIVGSQAPFRPGLQRKNGKFQPLPLRYLHKFQLSSPQIVNFQFTRTLLRGNDQFTSPTLRKSGLHTLTLKNLDTFHPSPTPGWYIKNQKYLQSPTLSFSRIQLQAQAYTTAI